jgi:hypothetical protein
MCTSPLPAAPAPVSFTDLVRTADEPTRWLWDGYVACGAVTLLTSRWKAGKTTLLSVLLARLGTGGGLAGRAVAAARAVVVSEESPQLWVQRGRRLEFGGHLGFICRPFFKKPTMEEWEALIDHLAGCVQSEPGRPTLVVIDPLAPVLPGPDENSAAAMLSALAPVRRLTAVGAAVLLLHHPRKQDGAPRGSGALPGFADVLIELSGVVAAAAGDRRRWLRSAGRYPETPASMLIELTADGCDYAVLAVPDSAADTFAAGWPVLRSVLTDTRTRLMRREILEEWPDDHPTPGRTQLADWLERAVAAGWVARQGSGRRRDPYRYWLPERDTELRREELIPGGLGPWG